MMRMWLAMVVVGGMLAGCTAKQPGLRMEEGVADIGEVKGAEVATKWNERPMYEVDAGGGFHVVGLKSYEGIEEPRRIWILDRNIAATQPGVASGHAENKEKDFHNIFDVPEDGGGAVRMLNRYRGDWWDGDQGTDRRDRQRAEVKGVGPHQKNDETFEYAMTWRTNADFTDPAKLTTVAYEDATQKRRRHFCHVFQLKATDGDAGAPMVTMSVEEGGTTAAVDYWDVGKNQPVVVRAFPWKAGEWNRVVIRVKASHAGSNEGALEVSVNGDEFTGMKGIALYRPRSTNYRPKWGLYRAAGPGSGAHDDWVEHKEVVVRKLTNDK